MSRPRISIAGLMAIVLFAATGFASLRNASDVWAQTMFTVAFVALLLSTLGAIAFKGEGRVLLSGFAIFGWGRLLISTQDARDGQRLRIRRHPRAKPVNRAGICVPVAVLQLFPGL